MKFRLSDLLARYQFRALLAVLLLCLPPAASAAGPEQERDGRGQEPMVVYLDADSARDAESCLPLHVNTTCSSLEAIASGVTSMESLTSLEIVIHIRSARLELKKPVKFKGLSVLRIIGAPTRTHIQCVANDSSETNGNSSAGVVFVAIENLFMENVVFEQCGAFYWYTKGHTWPQYILPIPVGAGIDRHANVSRKRELTFRAAIHILNSTNIQVRSIDVLSKLCRNRRWDGISHCSQCKKR